MRGFNGIVFSQVGAGAGKLEVIGYCAGGDLALPDGGFGQVLASLIQPGMLANLRIAQYNGLTQASRRSRGVLA